MRKTSSLTPAEIGQFNWLKPIPGDALAFWAKVAQVRNLDPKSMLTNGKTFTALPVGHGKHFCWPLSLQCKKKPNYKEA